MRTVFMERVARGGMFGFVGLLSLLLIASIGDCTHGVPLPEWNGQKFDGFFWSAWIVLIYRLSAPPRTTTDEIERGLRQIESQLDDMNSHIAQIARMAVDGEMRKRREEQDREQRQRDLAADRG
jgi:hypothetical protein